MTVQEKGADPHRKTTDPGKRIVLTTWGSLGDLHPYMAIALGLQARGHRPVLATIGFYRAKIEAAGIEFASIRPDFSGDIAEAREMIRRVMDAKRGPEAVIREVVLPHLRHSYDDLTEAVSGADMLITHPITYAGPLVAQKTGISWVSTVLSPLSFFSAYDPLVLAPAPGLARVHAFGPAINRSLIGLCRRMTRAWSDPIRALRAELGLSPGEDPIYEGQHAPERVLALFSEALAPARPDWPPQTQLTGFCFYDRKDGEQGLSPELTAFLEAGPPPIVFTLGSAAVLDAGPFYAESAEAARRLGRRAVLLVGEEPRNRLPEPLPEGIAVFDYAPYSAIFPRAAAIVHQGGIGTTGQALRAGRPMLVMPYSHDQPDNAARVTRLGVGRTISRNRYTAARAAAELRLLLDDPRYAQKAAEVGRRVQAEDGVAATCDAIEERLSATI